MSEGDREQEALLNFIGDLYDAAADPAGWQPIAAKLAHLFDCESCLLHLVNTAAGRDRFLGVTENFPARFWADYQSYYYQHDQWAVGAAGNLGRAFLGDEIAPADWIEKSPFINEFAAGAEVYSAVAAGFVIGATRLGLVGVHRPKGRAGFAEADRAKLDTLIPHLTRAIKLTLCLSAAEISHQASLEALERTGTAVIAVDRSGSILFANRLALAQMRQAAELDAFQGRFSATDRHAAARLAFLIQNVADTAAGLGAAGAGGAIAISRGGGRLPLALQVVPFRPATIGFGAPVPAALVFLRDPEMPSQATEILQDLFGLTPAQAAVAAKLADGRTQAEVAAILRISVHTVRDHLKAIFAKTGTSHQSQLVALLLRSVAGMI